MNRSAERERRQSVRRGPIIGMSANWFSDDETSCKDFDVHQILLVRKS